MTAKPGEIDRLVVLGAYGGVARPERMPGRKLYVVTRDDPEGSGTPRLVRIRAEYERLAEPKKLVILEGDAHAQFIFVTEQRDALMREILQFLTEP